MKRVTMFLFTLCLMVTMVTSVSAAASEPVTDSITIEGYQQWLSEKVTSDPGALEVLNKFNELSTDDQQKFVEALYSPEILQAYNMEEGSFTVNGLQSHTTRVSTETINATEFTRTFTASFGSEVMGIPLTKFTLAVEYSYNFSTSNATKVIDATGGHSNYNPGVIISESGSASKDLVSGYAHAKQIYSSKLVIAGGVVSYTEVLYAKANGQYGYGKFESTRPNIADIGSGSWTLLWIGLVEA